jgi:hypothetical protein
VSFPMALNTFNLNTFKLSVQVAWPSPGGRKDELRHLIRFLVRRPRAVIVHAAALGRHYVRMPTVVTSILADYLRQTGWSTEFNPERPDSASNGSGNQASRPALASWSSAPIADGGAATQPPAPRLRGRSEPSR